MNNCGNLKSFAFLASVRLSMNGIGKVGGSTALFSTPSFICQLSYCKSLSEVGVRVPGPYVRE